MTNQEFLQAVGMEIRVARIRKRLSIPQLSKLTGLSIACIGQIENGQVDARILSYKRIAEALEMDVKALAW
jgi:predicted transcriptional regulator